MPKNQTPPNPDPNPIDDILGLLGRVANDASAGANAVVQRAQGKPIYNNATTRQDSGNIINDTLAHVIDAVLNGGSDAVRGALDADRARGHSYSGKRNGRNADQLGVYPSGGNWKNPEEEAGFSGVMNDVMRRMHSGMNTIDMEVMRPIKRTIAENNQRKEDRKKDKADLAIRTQRKSVERLPDGSVITVFSQRKSPAYPSGGNWFDPESESGLEGIITNAKRSMNLSRNSNTKKRGSVRKGDYASGLFNDGNGSGMQYDGQKKPSKIHYDGQPIPSNDESEIQYDGQRKPSEIHYDGQPMPIKNQYDRQAMPSSILSQLIPQIGPNILSQLMPKNGPNILSQSMPQNGPNILSQPMPENWSNIANNDGFPDVQFIQDPEGYRKKRLRDAVNGDAIIPSILGASSTRTPTYQFYNGNHLKNDPEREDDPFMGFTPDEYRQLLDNIIPGAASQYKDANAEQLHYLLSNMNDYPSIVNATKGFTLKRAVKKGGLCKCGSGMSKSMCKCGGMGKSMHKSMLKSGMCKCGSGMSKSMCKCGGMGKSMHKSMSNKMDADMAITPQKISTNRSIKSSNKYFN